VSASDAHDLRAADAGELRWMTTLEVHAAVRARADAAQRAPAGSPEAARHQRVLEVLRRELARRGVLP